MKKIIMLACFFIAGFFLMNEKTANAQCDSIVFNYLSDTTQTWVVPAGVTSVRIALWGGGGGSGNQTYYYDAWCGGSGAYMVGTLAGPTLAGQTLTLYVPNGGQYYTTYNGGLGGWPHGGNGGNDYTYSEWGGGGGGYAGVAISGNYYVVVGGGGGGGSTGYGGYSYGGGGGATTGGDGITSFGTAGTGGTISSGGFGGSGYSLSGYNGSYLTGGIGQAIYANGDYGGGGGGAGYYGGGGGGDQGNSGGGGSSYPASPVTIAGITFSPILNLQGNMNPNTYGSAVAPGPALPGIGAGNIAAAGGGGMIIIYFYTATGNVISNLVCRSDTMSGSASVIMDGGIPPYTYSWSNGATTDTIKSLSAGGYTVNVTDSAGCVAHASVNITAPPVLTASVSQMGHIACFGNATGNAVAIVNGGLGTYTYSWMPSGETSDTATGLSAGTYTFTVTEPCKDTARTTVVITQPAVLSAFANQVGNIPCYGGDQGIASASVTGGTGSYTYLWSNTTTGDTASNLRAVSYTVIVEDSTGCAATAVVTITQPTVLKILSHTASDTGGCNGAAWLTVSGGSSPYTYFWSDGNTTDTTSSQCIGTYCCTVTDAHGCVNYDCATILSSAGVQSVTNDASSIKVYPDPNNGDFSISGIKPGEVIELYNYMGQKLSRSIADNSTVMHFNITGHANGIYMLRILGSDGTLITEKKIEKTE